MATGPFNDANVKPVQRPDYDADSRVTGELMSRDILSSCNYWFPVNVQMNFGETLNRCKNSARKIDLLGTAIGCCALLPAEPVRLFFILCSYSIAEAVRGSGPAQGTPTSAQSCAEKVFPVVVQEGPGSPLHVPDYLILTSCGVL